MGYDAHLMGLPGFIEAREKPKVRARYQAAVDVLQSRFPSLLHDRLTFNGAGSPTFRHYEGEALVNDLSAGTCLMKPTHYDLPVLADFEASSFIATPVLKRLQGGRIPPWKPRAADSRLEPERGPDLLRLQRQLARRK